MFEIAHELAPSSDFTIAKSVIFAVFCIRIFLGCEVKATVLSSSVNMDVQSVLYRVCNLRTMTLFFCNHAFVRGASVSVLLQ